MPRAAMTAPPARSALARWAVQFVNDPRDIAHLRLMAACAALIPAAGILFYLGSFSWWIALGYWAVWGLVLVDRFTLMLHCTSHRPLFNKRASWMNRVIPWVLCPFFGQSPETYFAHHMGMHHAEGNLQNDLSSTMKYQRDNLFHWLRYFTRFLVGGLVELAIYHWRKGRKTMFRRTVIGELSFLVLCAVGLTFAWQPTFVVFVVPLLTMRFLMMAGNWGQHAFVDLDDPKNDFKSSITCINSRYNERCFNDGYHIIHHLKPTLHYVEMAEEFEKNREEYGRQDAIVFDGVDFFGVWLLLMTHQHRALARAFVQLPGAPVRDEEQVLELMKSRLAPA